MTQGPTTSLLITFMIPMVIGNVFQQCYNMVDSMVVGKFINADALAAVGATGSLNFLIFSLCNGLANGIGILVAQAFGAGRHDTVKKLIANAFYLMLGAAALMGTFGFTMARTLLRVLQTQENILDASAGYMQVICMGVLGVSLYNCIAAILRGVGDSKTPLYFLILSSFMNVFLDLLFVVKLGIGVNGAAYATIITQFMSAFGAIAYAFWKNPMFRIERSQRKLDLDILKKACNIGIPLAAQSSLIALSCVILQGIVNTFGSAVVAAFTATSRFEQLIQQPYQSLANSVSTYTGQNIGAGNQARVKEGAKKGVLIMVTFTVIVTPLVMIFSPAIMSWFVNEPEVIAFGAQALRITSLFYIPLGMIYVMRGILNGAGDSTFSLINGVSEMAGRISFPKPLTMIPFIGVYGVWLGTGLTWLTVGIICTARYKSGVWKRTGKISRIQEEVQEPVGTKRLAHSA